MNNIKSFSVYGFLGTDDVEITFNEDKSIKILIGENGTGKTQLLNIFYYTLTANFMRLSEFLFDEIKLIFDQEEIVITRNEVDKYIQDNHRHPVIKEIIDLIGVSQFNRLRKEITVGRNVKRTIISFDSAYPNLREIAPIEYIVDILKSDADRLSRKSIKLTQSLITYAKRIKNNLSQTDVLYFPTFRRVEGELHDLGYHEEELFLSKEDSRLIHFGMDDVQKHFNNIQNTIDQLLKQGFSDISSEILSQLLEEEQDITDQDFLENIDENDVETLLSRVGSRI
ncbi:MAG: ATP-binding protein, partial [Pseudanabaenaceae cyanobacterium]